MHTLIAAEGLTHMELFAQAQIAHGNTVGLYTTTPKWMLHAAMPKNIEYHFYPGPIQILRGLLRNRVQMRRTWENWDSDFFDRIVAKGIEPADLLIAPSSSSLYTGRTIQRGGGKYVVDRGCPDIQWQEASMVEESRKAGGVFEAAAPWFMKRQLAEYDECDFLVVPSDFSRNTYAPAIKAKTLVLRLTGQVRTVDAPPPPQKRPFTVGVVGGQPMRKGYMYLLEAWKQLGWTDARLMLRTNINLLKFYPKIMELINGMPNVSIVSYVPDINDFYRQCDTFVLPSTDDGFGLALFEAIGQGVPCIATTNCGASELLLAERDFLQIEAFSTQAIHDALTRMRDSSDLRWSLAVNGLQRVRELGAAESQSEYRKGVNELMARAFPA